MNQTVQHEEDRILYQRALDQLNALWETANLLDSDDDAPLNEIPFEDLIFPIVGKIHEKHEKVIKSSPSTYYHRMKRALEKAIHLEVDMTTKFAHDKELNKKYQDLWECLRLRSIKK